MGVQRRRLALGGQEVVGHRGVRTCNVHMGVAAGYRGARTRQETALWSTTIRCVQPGSVYVPVAVVL